MRFKFSEFTELLSEGRKEDLYNQFKKQIDDEREFMESGDFKDFSFYDVMLREEFSKNTNLKYGQFLLKTWYYLVDQGEFKDVKASGRYLLEITSFLIDMIKILQLFDKNSNYFSSKDINFYSKNKYDLLKDEYKEALLKIQSKEAVKSVIKLYEDNKFLIVVPKSHASSCHYGAGTKWCTTMDDNSYYNRYTSSGTLIYFINKKITQEESNLYKIAFYIKNDGSLEIYDGPDARVSLSYIKTSFTGELWDLIRDTIINYLVQTNKNGIENFLSGDEMIEYLLSNNIDPLNALVVPNSYFKLKKLIEVFGSIDKVINYIENERGLNPIKFLGVDDLYKIRDTDLFNRMISLFMKSNINIINHIFEDNSENETLDVSNIMGVIYGIIEYNTDMFLETVANSTYKVINHLPIDHFRKYKIFEEVFKLNGDHDNLKILFEYLVTNTGVEAAASFISMIPMYRYIFDGDVNQFELFVLRLDDDGWNESWSHLIGIEKYLETHTTADVLQSLEDGFYSSSDFNLNALKLMFGDVRRGVMWYIGKFEIYQFLSRLNNYEFRDNIIQYTGFNPETFAEEMGMTYTKLYDFMISQMEKVIDVGDDIYEYIDLKNVLLLFGGDINLVEKLTTHFDSKISPLQYISLYKDLPNDVKHEKYLKLISEEKPFRDIIVSEGKFILEVDDWCDFYELYDNGGRNVDPKYMFDRIFCKQDYWEDSYYDFDDFDNAFWQIKSNDLVIKEVKDVIKEKYVGISINIDDLSSDGWNDYLSDDDTGEFVLTKNIIDGLSSEQLEDLISSVSDLEKIKDDFMLAYSSAYADALTDTIGDDLLNELKDFLGSDYEWVTKIVTDTTTGKQKNVNKQHWDITLLFEDVIEKSSLMLIRDDYDDFNHAHFLSLVETMMGEDVYDYLNPRISEYPDDYKVREIFPDILIYRLNY